MMLVNQVVQSFITQNFVAPENPLLKNEFITHIDSVHKFFYMAFNDTVLTMSCLLIHGSVSREFVLLDARNR